MDRNCEGREHIFFQKPRATWRAIVFLRNVAAAARRHRTIYHSPLRGCADWYWRCENPSRAYHQHAEWIKPNGHVKIVVSENRDGKKWLTLAVVRWRFVGYTFPNTWPGTGFFYARAKHWVWKHEVVWPRDGCFRWNLERLLALAVAMPWWKPPTIHK